MAQINHGDPNLVCQPATWWSVVLFFLVNYLAHCFTVRSFPGESTYDQVVAVVIALLFPSAGLIRAVDGIVRHSRFLRRHRRRRGGELAQAARSGALLMVIRNKYWRPAVGDTIRGIRFQRLWGGVGGPWHLADISCLVSSRF